MRDVHELLKRIPSHDPELVLYASPGTWWETIMSMLFLLMTRAPIRTVEASPIELRVQWSLLGLTRTTRIPAASLKDIYIEPPTLFTNPRRARAELLSFGCAIVARGADGTASFGRWLSRKVKVWLCALLRGVLASIP